MTVEWSRPPNLRPISGYERGVGTLDRYIATCRGRTTARAALGGHFRPVNPIELAHRALDLVNRDSATVGREDIGELFLGELQRHFLPRQLSVGDQLVEAPDELTHIAGNGARQEFDDVFGHAKRGKARQLAFKDRFAKLDIGGLNVGHEAHRQAR